MRGVQVRAATPRGAVVEAVEKTLEGTGACYLLGVVRVSHVPQGSDYRDVYFEAPFEDEFPELFERYPDVTTASVEAR